MARRRSRRSEIGFQRDDFPIATRSVLEPSYLDLRAIEDRRFWYPEPLLEPARAVSRVADSFVTTVGRPASRGRGRPFSLKKYLDAIPQDIFRFEKPENVAICIRRKERREVLFANRKRGKGSRQRKRRRNEYSDVSCR